MLESTSMKLGQFSLRDLLLATAAVAAALGTHLAFWEYGQFKNNYSFVLGYYLLAACMASALSIDGRYRVRPHYMATALLGWAYFLFPLKMGRVETFSEVEWLQKRT